VCCKTNCEFLVLSRVDFESVLSTFYVKQKQEILEYIKGNHFFTSFESNTLESLAQGFDIRFYNNGDRIFTDTRCIYIVKAGDMKLKERLGTNEMPLNSETIS